MPTRILLAKVGGLNGSNCGLILAIGISIIHIKREHSIDLSAEWECKLDETISDLSLNLVDFATMNIDQLFWHLCTSKGLLSILENKANLVLVSTSIDQRAT